MQKNILSIVTLVILCSFQALAQQGKIRGTVYEEETGESLIGVTVVIAGTSNGAITDFDGKFELRVEPGTYTLQASFVSFETVTIEGVTVQSDEVTVLNQVWMREEVTELEAVVVTAEALRDSETALMTVKRKSPNLMDGISAVGFSKIGDSDAASAVKRVTGVSVEGGKYVFVRGLGDRYTKTTLNNVDIPGLDPDRNSIQMDIFPTNLINNMMVLKSSTADMPADFTGGVVNIETKDFPEERQFDISVSAGFNPDMHFNKDYITYNGGGTDAFGFDDGTRRLPANAKLDPLPSRGGGEGLYSEAAITDFHRSFDRTLGVKNQTSFMNYSVGISYGDQKNVGADNKLGYVFTLSYKNSTEYYKNLELGEWFVRTTDRSVTELDSVNIQNGSEGKNEVLIGGLAGVAYKTQKSKYKLNIMHLQNGITQAGFLNKLNADEIAGQSGFEGESHQLAYQQRELTNLMLNGVHHNEDATWTVDWRLSPTRSKIYEPDLRRMPFTTERQILINTGANGAVERSWRNLEEINLVGRLDFTREHSLFGNDAKFKFGASHVYKERDYEILGFQYNISGVNGQVLVFDEPDPSTVLTDANLYPGPISLQSANPDPNPNKFNSISNNTGLYVSSEFNATAKLKAIVGLRAENFEQLHTGRTPGASDIISSPGNADLTQSEIDVLIDAAGEQNLDDEKVLDNFDLFPSLNVIYALSEDQNLRFSYARTIARPSFKELSFAQIIDPITNRIYNGGLFAAGDDWDGNLKSTYINNYDLRWELFMNGGQLFSVSAFYKTFEDPIELVRDTRSQTSANFQTRNVGNGTIYGAEFEIRKNLSFLADPLEYFIITGNVTLVRSEIEMSPTEFSSRVAMRRDGEEIDDTRPMAGQAPYIINGGLSYDNPEIGFDAGLFYNVKASTLIVVAGNPAPDVYAEPFHSLNFNLNKSFGAKQQFKINFSVSNILDDDREELFKSYESSDKVFTRRSPGRTFGLGFKYAF